MRDWRSSPNLGASKRNYAVAAAIVLLSGCAAPLVQTGWVKAGADDTMTARAVDDCRVHAAQVQANQQGINEDRTATLGRNWALGYMGGLEANTMQQQTAALTDQAFNNCMRAKGFSQKS
jgi:hypothetical protein